MHNFGDEFLDENKLFNDFFLQSETSSNNAISNNNENKSNMNIKELGTNQDEEDELKSFAQSLNCDQSSKDNSHTFLNKVKNSNNNQNSANLFENYLSRLKNFGFPEIGKIKLSDDPREQEKTFKFFDYIIMKKANNLDDYQKYKRSNDNLAKKCEELESQITKYQKEINNLKNELKLYSREKNDYEFKSSKQKDYYEKLMNNTKKENIHLNNKINKILLDKRALEEKYQSLIEMLNKNDINKTKIINTAEICDYVQKNNISKMIDRVKGAEKLVETLKGGYNDSLRELLFEISALKNFIFDYHTEITLLIDDYENLDKELLNMSFLDTVSNIKDIFNINIGKLKERLGQSQNEQMNFSNLNKCLNDEKIRTDNLK